MPVVAGSLLNLQMQPLIGDGGIGVRIPIAPCSMFYCNSRLSLFLQFLYPKSTALSSVLTPNQLVWEGRRRLRLFAPEPRPVLNRLQCVAAPLPVTWDRLPFVVMAITSVQPEAPRPKKDPPIRYHTNLHYESKWNRKELHNPKLFLNSLIGISELKTPWTIWLWKKNL